MRQDGALFSKVMLSTLLDCHEHGLAAKSYRSFGTETLEELTMLAEQITHEHPSAIFFASKLIVEHESWLTRLLHNQTTLVMQRRLHLRGIPMIILPMKLNLAGKLAPQGKVYRL